MQCGDTQVELRALRISFVGELGWELHVPRASCATVYRALMEEGADLGVRNGISPLLRLNKVFRLARLWKVKDRTGEAQELLAVKDAE